LTRSQDPDAAFLGTVFFLSDYGLHDEFVGVVHAVLRRLAPHVEVIDLTHEVPSFDVRAGALSLERTVPHLGTGVVLAVVDPGVGGERRGVVISVASTGGPRYFVGPDNGLLLASAQAGGVVQEAVSLFPRSSDPGADGPEVCTFDGRDVFAPAVAALCCGADPGVLGTPVDVASLVALPQAVVERGRLSDGRRCLRSEVTWVDHFGNVQLAAATPDLPRGAMLTLSVELVRSADRAADIPVEAVMVRSVRTFSELMTEEIGVLVDSNRHLALVVREGSAALRLGIRAGDLVNLVS
jgi:S-adenosylmethionine hydrolase